MSDDPVTDPISKMLETIRTRDSTFPRHYVLIDKTPIAVDFMTWAKAFEERCKSRKADTDIWRVGLDVISNRVSVSTVFLGLDHNHFGGESILFETMIFGGPLRNDMHRYHTWAEAEQGHAAMTEAARFAKRDAKGWRKHVRRQKALGTYRHG